MSRGAENAGIVAVGVYLPDQVRKNDWWPPEVVKSWEHNAAAGLVRASRREEIVSEGMALTATAIAETLNDPFRGFTERRVMAKDEKPSAMETKAAKDAIERAGLQVSEIGMLMTYNNVGDYAGIPTALAVHRDLGLSPNCMVLGTESSCNSFMSQMAVAQQMIRGGAVKYALLVQSAEMSRICRPEDQHSAWFGDGATAVVMGPCAADEGVLAISHRTDGSYYKVLVLGSPGKHWYEENACFVYSEAPLLAQKMVLRTADMGKEVVDEAMQMAGLAPNQIDFYASHQSTCWFRRVTQQACGLAHARHADTYPWSGSMGACNIPITLATGQREGSLRKGDRIAMYAGGSGLNYTGAVVRWTA